MKTGATNRKISVVRDVVHSDISFESVYFRILNTKEMQRLNRIKQMSCEYMVFPTATHTRFVHSIGVYAVMKKILDRLAKHPGKEPVFTTEQRHLALCSALLHDLGHGPYSHSFEDLFELETHEMWTMRILTSESTEIHQLLKEEFSPGFIDKLVRILNKETEFQGEDSACRLIVTLLSSQLDADRMDYLLRDSYFTSVTNGNYDIERLIRAVEVDQQGAAQRICVNQKYLSTVEEFILARYYMHKEVYQHTLKKQMDGILKKIVLRVRDLHRMGYPPQMDPRFEKLVSEVRLSTEEYCSIDDAFFTYHLELWCDEEDYLLAKLSQAFVHRRKFERYKFAERSSKSSEQLKEVIRAALVEHGFHADVDFVGCPFYIENHIGIDIYNNHSENIWVKDKEGNICDISEVSLVINALNAGARYEQECCYLNFDIFEHLYSFDLRSYVQ